MGDILGIFQVHLQLKMTNVLSKKDCWKLSPGAASEHELYLVVNLIRFPNKGQV